MKPTIGRIVVYSTTSLDQRMINEHPHNTPREQTPAIIVFVNDDNSVNLKLFIDGCGELYKKDVVQGNEIGQWAWPVIENQHTMIISDEVEKPLSETAKDDEPAILGNLSLAGIPNEPESTTPLVVLDEATGKHKAVPKSKDLKKEEETIVLVTDNPAA